MSKGSPIHLALALTGDQVLTVLADDALIALLDDAPLAFTVVGADRLSANQAATDQAATDQGGADQGGAGADGRRTIDPSVATSALASRTSHAAFLLASSPARDHPYNLARRVASVGHLSRGRTGLAVGTFDPFVAAGSGRSRGEGPVLTGPAETAAARDLALAVQKLEQTWPFGAIVADRDQRIFARGDRIRHANHDGVFPTAGPLTLPSTPEGSSVLAWWANALDELEAAAEVADVVIVPAEAAWTTAARSAFDAAPRGHFADPARRPLLFAVADVAPGTEVRSWLATAAELSADGVVLRPAGADPRETIESSLGGEHPAGSLRERLGLPRTAELLADGPGVFPAPVPRP